MLYLFVNILYNYLESEVSLLINWFDVFMFLLVIFAFCVGTLLLVLLVDFVAKKIYKSTNESDSKKDDADTKQNNSKNNKQ